MKYLVWLLRAAIFFLLFAFSLNNQHEVVVHWFLGAQWRGSLVLAILVAFGLGLLVGMGSWLPSLWRQKRESHDQQTTSSFAATQLSERE